MEKTYWMGSYFVTTEDEPESFVQKFDITPEQLFDIKRGAGLSIVDGVLVVEQLPPPEPEPQQETE